MIELGPRGPVGLARPGGVGRARARGIPSRRSTSGSTRCSTTARPSATRGPARTSSERYWPPDLQLMAKDILKFHAVIWPAMLMAAGLELPRRLMIHGYVLKGGEKMSKTTGNVVDPFPFIERLRHRRAALLPRPRGALRRGRHLHRRGLRGALLGRARQRARQPPQPRGQHDRPLPRRGRAGRPRRRRRDGRRGGRGRRGADAADFARARPLARHRGRLAPRAAPQPPGGAARPVDARQGPGARRRARPDPAQPGRGPARRRDPALAGDPRLVRADPGRARPGPRRRRAGGRGLGRRAPRARRVAPADQLFPRVEEEAA